MYSFSHQCLTPLFQVHFDHSEFQDDEIFEWVVENFMLSNDLNHLSPKTHYSFTPMQDEFSFIVPLLSILKQNQII